MNTPLVSVIVPVYNVEKTLARCLESICGQSCVLTVGLEMQESALPVNIYSIV